MNALATANDNFQIRTMDDIRVVSKMLSLSGYFSDAKGEAQCGVKVLAGQELGIGPFASMTGIHIIKGKPALGANQMAAAVKRNHKYDYRVRELTGKVCKIEFFQGSESLGVSEFSLEDAKKAGTQNLDKYPRNMLFARAMSNGIKFYTPDVFDTAVYTPEEMGAQVNGEGEVIDVSVVPEAAPKKGGLSPSVGPKNNQRFKALCRLTGLPADVIKEICEKQAGTKVVAELDAVDTELVSLAALCHAAHMNGWYESDKAAKRGMQDCLAKDDAGRWEWLSEYREIEEAEIEEKN